MLIIFSEVNWSCQKMCLTCRVKGTTGAGNQPITEHPESELRASERNTPWI